ncbi:MAG: GNAT family N-acetyltransferase [Pseudomonadota bacterium]
MGMRFVIGCPGVFGLCLSIIRVSPSRDRAHSQIMLKQLENVGVRPAKVADADELVRIHREAWTDAYRCIIPPDILDGMIQNRSSAWWRRSLGEGETVLLLEVMGRPVGYATCGRERGTLLADSSTDRGEIYELYLEPTVQGLGLGEFLFEACRGVFDEWGLRGPVVWVLADNQEALQFYQARGGRSAGKVLEKIGRFPLGKVALVWD